MLLPFLGEKMDILQEIKKIRDEEKLDIYSNNTNPYRLLIKEKDGFSAYYFSLPIYRPDRKLIDFNWISKEGKHYHSGSNSDIEVNENTIKMSNIYGEAELILLGGSDIELLPTFNGIAVKAEGNQFNFTIKTKGNYQSRENGGYFALMKDEFVPLLTVSGIYGEKDNKYYPLEIKANKNNDLYEITVSGLKSCNNILFEINMQTQKLMFDTTVESKNPDKNNAFGGVAFLGESEFYGEQWLYSRIDTMQLIDLNSYIVKEAKLYMRKYDKGNNVLQTYKMTAPWCSFGSTWNTKAAFSGLLHIARLNKKYVITEVTDVIKEILRLNEPRNPGVVIKGNNAGYSVISTADNYLYPQILEIKLKNN
jgi:hypothetical protein